MGVLETRVLDFDNIILPSMNERIFPRKNCYAIVQSRSFEAMLGWHGHHQVSGVQTPDYFYGLNLQCKRYYMGRTRTTGARSSEMSRATCSSSFIYPDGNVRHRKRIFDIPATGRKQTA